MDLIFTYLKMSFVIVFITSQMFLTSSLSISSHHDRVDYFTMEIIPNTINRVKYFYLHTKSGKYLSVDNNFNQLVLEKNDNQKGIFFIHDERLGVKYEERKKYLSYQDNRQFLTNFNLAKKLYFKNHLLDLMFKKFSKNVDHFEDYYNIILTYHNCKPCSLIKTVDFELYYLFNNIGLYLNSNLYLDKSYLCLSYYHLEEDDLSSVENICKVLGCLPNISDFKSKKNYYVTIYEKKRKSKIHAETCHHLNKQDIINFYTPQIELFNKYLRFYDPEIEVILHIEEQKISLFEESSLSEFQLYTPTTVVDHSLPDEYEEVRILGKGSYGTAYEVIKKDNNQHYVIKKILKRENSFNEVYNMKKLGCTEYFACFVEYFDIEKYLYIVMEYLGNYTPLNVLIEDKIFKEAFISNNIEIKNWFEKLCEKLCYGLKTIHKLGIAHNDVKPDNVLIDINRLDVHIKYIDFGISCYEKNCKSFNGGTLVYNDPSIMIDKNMIVMALDHIVPRKYLLNSQQADLWSLGVMIYEMVLGYPPFFFFFEDIHNSEKKTSPEEFIEKVFSDLPDYEIGSDAAYYRKKIYEYLETYFVVYDYKKDPRKNKIDALLKDYQINLNVLLTRKKRKYFI
jgi:tRNA A-37 threonylcarbamoyl transferase component Bud32